MTGALTSIEKLRLADQETQIERGVSRVGQALAVIRDQRLYRDNYPTFEDYCRNRWGITRQHANRQIAAAEVAAILEPVGSMPEAQARELAPLRDNPDQMREVWEAANRATEGQPTATAIRAARKPKPDPADLVAEFPELDHYADRPADLVRIGTALRGYAEPERAMRRQALAATIAAEQRRATEPPAAGQEEPDLADLAMAIFMACNAAARTIARSGGTDTVNAALPAYTAAEVDNWRGQFESLASTCHDLASACRPGLRRVK